MKTCALPSSEVLSFKKNEEYLNPRNANKLTAEIVIHGPKDSPDSKPDNRKRSHTMGYLLEPCVMDTSMIIENILGPNFYLV
jgi:hypothetical protein